MFLLQLIMKGVVNVYPGFNGEKNTPSPVGLQFSAPVIIALRLHRRALPVTIGKDPPDQIHRQVIMAIGKNHRRNSCQLMNHSLGRKSPAFNTGADLLNSDAWHGQRFCQRQDVRKRFSAGISHVHLDFTLE